MKQSSQLLTALLFVAFAGAASAQGTSRTQVEADLAAAQRNGDMLVPGELGLPQRDLRPDLYPSATTGGKSRAQVEAELATAQHNGDLLLSSGLTERTVAPGMYPAAPQVAGKTREQVKQELAVAIRDGDMLAPGDSGLTEYQMEPQRYAQQRAEDQAARLAQQQGTNVLGGPN